MKQVYNLAGLMRKLKVDSFSELQERGYDVRSYLERRKQELYDVQSYLERRKQELTDELEAIIYGLQELDERDKEIARSQTQSELNEEFDNPYGGSTVYPYTRASSDDDDEDTPFSSPHASSDDDDEDTPFSSPHASSDDDDEDTPFSSPQVSSRKYDFNNHAATGLPSNFGFNPRGIYSNPDYIYIGT